MVLRICLTLSLVFALSLPVQNASAQIGSNVEIGSSSGGPRKQLATIIFAGLGGAILGLSTLSFYGRPQDHLSNIAIGFGVGIIGGTVLMTYQAASNPREFYGTPPGANNLYPQSETFSDLALKNDSKITSTRIGFNFEF